MKTKNTLEIRSVLANKATLLILLVFTALSLAFVPNFASAANLASIESNFSYLILAAIGMTFVTLNGGIDFSIIAIMNLSGIVGGLIMNSKNGWLAGSALAIPAAIAAMLLIGLSIGAINALAVVKLKMPSFMATLATNLVFSGAALFITKSDTIIGLPSSYKFIGGGKVWVVSFSLILAIVCIVITHLLLSRTTLGRRIYAVGTSHAVARISGVNVGSVITTLFLLSGLFAALSGIVVSSWMGACRPNVADDMLMDIVAGVVIGGTSPAGGEGKITGTVVGTLIIVVMSNALALLGLNWYVINTIKGLLLVCVAFVDAAKRNAKR